MRKKKKKYWDIYKKSKKILIVLVWLVFLFKKHCHESFSWLHSSNKQTTKKETMHSNMNLCCIEWFQYNIEIWSKKGTWHTLVAFSDLCLLPPQRAECVCPGVTHAHPEGAHPCCSWPRQLLTNSTLCPMTGVQNCHFNMQKHCWVLFREPKMLELNQCPTAD